jgi:hypothetical protein
LALFNVQNPMSFSGLNNNGSVAVADFNKDGFTDAVLSNFGTDYSSGAGTTITVLYGRNGGGFNRINLNTSGQNVSFVSIADINGDSWPDLLAANQNQQNTGSVSVFRNDGAGNLSLVGTPFSTFSNNPAWVGLADVTGDGILDAIVASSGRDFGGGNIIGNNVNIFQGNADLQGHGNFAFSASPITTLAPGTVFTPTALALADFDGDGLKDIAAAVPDAPPNPGHVDLFRGTGSGGFAAFTQFGSGGVQPLDIKAAYLNGDNKPDLVVANGGDPNANPEFSGDAVGVLLNTSSSPGNVNFGAATSLMDNTHGTFAVAIDDFNLDGKSDIAAVNYGTQLFPPPAAFVSLYMGSGTGTFTLPSPATYDTRTNFGGGQYLAAGDFDQNGIPDLIVAHATNLVGLLLNTSAAGKAWIGPASGGDWSTGTNWNASGVPGAGDAVLIWGSRPVTLSASATVAALTLTGGALLTVAFEGHRVLQTSGLLIGAGSKLNLSNNQLIVAGGDEAAANALIASGRNGGAWNGATGIVTTSATGNLTTLGVTKSNGNVTVKFTYGGDANLDGKINVDDYGRIDSNIGLGTTGWFNGDFNYDGKVNVDDYGIIDANIGVQGPPISNAASVDPFAGVLTARGRWANGNVDADAKRTINDDLIGVENNVPTIAATPTKY